MTFDDDLRRTFDSLGNRLNDEIAAALTRAAQELTAVAAADRDRTAAGAQADAEARIAAAVAEAAHLAEQDKQQALEHAARSADERLRAALDEAASAASAAAAEAAAQQADSNVPAQLASAVRALDEAPTLTSVLNTLADRARETAPRAALLLVRGGRTTGWRVDGFDGDAGATGLALDAGLLADAARAGSARTTDAAQLPPFAVAGASTGVVHAAAVALTLSGAPVAMLYADTAGRPAPDGWDAPIDILARHAARRLEAIAAFTAARVLFGASSGAPTSAAPQPASAGFDADAAQRYARLLVSEIKLYHEAAVSTGREQRDLGLRLGGEIARARALYDERVPESVRAQSDFFHAELVRTLANGDAALLGDR